MSNKNIRLTITKPDWFDKVNYSALVLALHLAELAHYDDEYGGYTLTLVGYHKRLIAKDMGLSNIGSIANLLTELVKKQVLHRVDTGVYLLNPNFITLSEKNCDRAKEYFSSIDEWMAAHTN